MQKWLSQLHYGNQHIADSGTVATVGLEGKWGIMPRQGSQFRGHSAAVGGGGSPVNPPVNCSLWWCEFLRQFRLTPSISI